jgi:hypothetical protein
MSKTVLRSALVLIAIAAGALAGCPPPKGGKGGGGGSSGVDPNACGDVSGSDVGRKAFAFLQATADLDKASADLEISVRGACRKMAKELGVSTEGDTKEVCTAAANALRDNLEISVSHETRLVTRYTEPVCTTNIDFEAKIAAECEASVDADINISCQGSCGGTCSGACDGTCAAKNAQGECAGQCDGTCQGRCSGECNGYADVDASVECKASAEVRATVQTECTEPKVEVVQQDVTIVDDSKFQMAMAAIDAGMPTIIRAGAKAGLVAKAIVNWGVALAKLVKSSGQFVEQIGERGICVGAQIAAAFAASAQIEARIDVSIEMSAEVSASGGATAQ